MLQVPHSYTWIHSKPPIVCCCENHLKVVYDLVLGKIWGTLFLWEFGWDHTNSACHHGNPKCGEHKIGVLLYFPASCTETHWRCTYKSSISMVHNVRFHELLLLFHFLDNFWSGWYFTSLSPPPHIHCVHCLTLSWSGLQYWKMHWHLISVKLSLSFTALWLLHLCSF